eukprot:CAMPEP_0196172054 /NCGR_PEP_ID=MMETSP0911-20130528/5863_1 /TAXON_ID=49265 /ORGANISM="Thalassiosira rotula, Strain GSO102" /LENGTH=54 /DNA_ID=CAMNT_0041438983 /DNA_START=48 /DNA_END=209 /DNA_ORIENTATION=-
MPHTDSSLERPVGASFVATSLDLGLRPMFNTDASFLDMVGASFVSTSLGLRTMS